MKLKFTTLLLISLAIFTQTNMKAQGLRADLAVASLSVTNVNGNSVTFTYRVKNVGNSPLDLKRLYFQTYVSTNSVYNTTDLPTGGAIFGNTAPVLSFGQSYSGSWTSNSSSSLATYHYLLFTVKVRSGYTSQETNFANNTLAKNLTPSFADLAISTIKINTVTSNTTKFTYTITNKGASTLYLDRFYFQAYVSKNSTYDNTDVPAGGSVFGGGGVLTLAPGATYTGSWTSNTSVSLQTYPYLIFDVRLVSGKIHPQISTTNDRYIKYLYDFNAKLSINDETIEKIPAFKMEKNADVLTLENVMNEELQTDYILYSLSGEKISEGSFTEKKEINIVGLKSGIYIVNLHNGSKHESLKLFIQ